MAACPYGKASMCFPLAIPVKAALNVLRDIDEVPVSTAEVAGFTTGKTRAAGADSFRLHLPAADAPEQVPHQGAHLVALRFKGHESWLPGLAGMRRPQEGSPAGMEVVVLGRPDAKFTALMYLPEDTLVELAPVGSIVEFRLLRFLLPVQHDCPEQWLRDRLLRLANLVEEAFSVYTAPPPPAEEVRAALQGAGLCFGAEPKERAGPTLPADTGDRVSQEELGYWDEEMRLNTRCAATMDGGSRMDYFMSHLPA